METLIINVPEQKSKIVKLLLKELGVTIQNKTKAKQLAREINKGIKPGAKPGMDEIAAEIKEVRTAVQTPYNQEFVDKILQGDENFKAGKGKKMTMEELNSLWK
ncbi:MAG TPA: DUF2683 family protein [Mucilaginibacter sp.]|jgi:hypothetical protein|nr:DUF2683 family protein [Mucilaginibacter sp.]